MLLELATVLTPSACSAAAATVRSIASWHSFFRERCNFRPLDPVKLVSSQYGHCIGGIASRMGTVLAEEVTVGNHKDLLT